MRTSRLSRWTFVAAASASWLLIAVALQAADQAKPNAPDAKDVELFAAMKDGDINVKLIPKNVREANVLIENKGDKPLHIKLPDAFAAVPVLAQMGGMGGRGGRGMGGGMGGMGGGMGGMGGGGMQGMGGGMGGMGGGGMGGMGGGGMGGMGGMMNVDPGKIAKIKVPTVCLEHGKQEPNPRVPYELRPIESFTDNSQVIEVCKMLGRGEVAQNTAQAATWHLTDGLSWETLVSKDRVHLSNGYTEKYFSPAEIGVAMRVVTEATRRVRDESRKVAETSASASTK